MAITEFHYFRNVNVVERTTNLIMPPSTLSLKLTIYNDDELKGLSPDIKNATFDGVMTEIELVSLADHKAKKITINKPYIVKLYQPDNMFEATEFDALFLSQVRTVKENANTNRIFYYGIKTGKKCLDDLMIFSNYKPKTFLLKTAGGDEIVIKKCFSYKEEKDLFNNYKDKNCLFYALDEFIEKDGICADGKEHVLDQEYNYL